MAEIIYREFSLLTPFSKSFFKTPSSIFPSFSIFRTSGAISSLASLVTKDKKKIHGIYKCENICTYVVTMWYRTSIAWKK